MARALTLILTAFGLFAALPAFPAETRDPHIHFFNPHTDDLKAELADARSAGKKAIFILFEQEGCPGCIHMKNHVLNRLEVQNFYRQRFLNFAVDILSAVPIADFAGRGHTEKSFAQSLNVKGTPTLAFYDLAGNEVVRIVGPVREPDEFLLLGEFVSSGAYQTQRFAEFKQRRQKRKGS